MGWFKKNTSSIIEKDEQELTNRDRGGVGKGVDRVNEERDDNKGMGIGGRVINNNRGGSSYEYY